MILIIKIKENKLFASISNTLFLLSFLFIHPLLLLNDLLPNIIVKYFKHNSFKKSGKYAIMFLHFLLTLLIYFVIYQTI